MTPTPSELYSSWSDRRSPGAAASGSRPVSPPSSLSSSSDAVPERTSRDPIADELAKMEARNRS